MEKLELVAIKKDGIFYVRSMDKFPRTFEDESKLRFDETRLKSFDDKWLMFDKLPLTAEWCIEGRHTVVGFTLKESFDVTGQTPYQLPAGAFDCHCVEGDDDYVNECKNVAIRGLYVADYEKEPDTWQNVDLSIEIIDEDCKPLINPKYEVHVDFPHYINKHIVVRHKFPCHIEAEDVFKYIVTALKANMPNHCYSSSDYGFNFAVMMRAPVLHEETERIDTKSFNARKSKWVDRPLREYTFKVIEVCTPGHDYGDVCWRMDGTDYYDIEKKMDGVIQGYLDLMKARPVVCPHCKGYGWFEVNDETK